MRYHFRSQDRNCGLIMTFMAKREKVKRGHLMECFREKYEKSEGRLSLSLAGMNGLVAAGRANLG